jgi:hypothetical protein
MIRSSSLKQFADKFSEMTLEWFSCKSETPNDTLSKSMIETAVSRRHEESGEELGFEMDEEASLQTAYQLSRV